MPNTYQLAISGHDPGGNYIQNVFHYSLSEAGAGSGYDYAKALITAWITANMISFANLLGNDTLIDYINAKRVSGPGGPSASTVVGTIGTGAGGSESSGFAADVQWQTSSGTNRPGHTFIAPVPTGSFGVGIWQAPFTTNVGLWVTQMMTQITLAGALGTADFGIFTRKTKTFNQTQHGQLMPKPTMLNKRTLPVI